MDINRLLIVGLILLTILTVSCVSASDNLTQDDTVTVQNDEIPLETDSSDKLSDGSYYDDNFYVSVQENYTHDKSDWNSCDLIYINSYSENNGTFSVCVDDSEKMSFNITNGYFSVEDDGYGAYNKYYKMIFPDDLGLDLGSYNIKVKFNDSLLVNSDVTLAEKDDFDIWLQNPYYCESDYWQSSSFIIIDSNHLNTGTLEIYVNGTSKISYAVNNGSFEEIADCSNKSRYLAASDLLDGYGYYNIKIIFTENGTAKTLRDENVTVAERQPTVDPKVELYFDFYYLTLPADNVAHIYLPYEATGSLTISYDNEINKSVSYSKGYGTYYMHAWSLNHLGNHTITVTYTGDDFGTLTASETITVFPKVTSPFYVSTGEKFKISVLTHDWVDGTFNVYEYNNGVKGKLLASDDLYRRHYGEWATASVELSSTAVGLNRFYLEFDYFESGDCPMILEIYVVENTKNVTVSIPSEVESGKDFNVTVTAPVCDYNFVYISVDGNTPEFYSLKTGEVIKTISNLASGYHTVSVQYNNGDFVDGKLIGDVYSNTFTVKVATKTEITSANITAVYGSGENLTVTLSDASGNALAGKEISIRIDGGNYTRITDNEGKATLELDMLPDNYVAEIEFKGDDDYMSASASVGVHILKVESTLTPYDVNMYYGDKNKLIAVLSDANGNKLSFKNVLISIDGVDYKTTSDKDGKVLLDVVLAAENYTANVIFSGDEIYNSSSCSVNINISKAPVHIDTLSGIASSKNLILEARLFDSNKNPLPGMEIAMEINGDILCDITNESGFVKFSKVMDVGNYTATLRFMGNQNYSISTASVQVAIFDIVPTVINASDLTTKYGSQDYLLITLKDTKGNALANKSIMIALGGKKYSEVTDAEGQVKFSVNQPSGNYIANISFAGDNSYFASSKSVNVVVNKLSTVLTASDITSTYNIAKNLVITLKDANGKVLAGKSISVKINNKNYNRITDASGRVKLSLNLASKKYTAVITFAGDNNYIKSVKNAKVTVNKAKTKLIASSKKFKVKTKTKKVKVTLKNNRNSPIKKAVITLKVNKKTYKAKTNSKGVATFKVKLTKKGTYKAIYRYGGSSNYKAAGKTVKIKVKK